MNATKPSESVRVEDVRSDRRKMLTLVGAGAVAALVGPGDAEAAGLTVVITNVLNNLSVQVPVKKSCAVTVCAAIELLNDHVFEFPTLTCQIVESP